MHRSFTFRLRYFWYAFTFVILIALTSGFLLGRSYQRSRTLTIRVFDPKINDWVPLTGIPGNPTLNLFCLNDHSGAPCANVQYYDFGGHTGTGALLVPYVKDESAPSKPAARQKLSRV